ncbi:MAG TPA: hypothetical protein VGS28_02220 [Candidatus Saccharimonadales bacterium]|nr:hypothetical protein [Candidatus Saccharimonadales bacterium]
MYQAELRDRPGYHQPEDDDDDDDEFSDKSRYGGRRLRFLRIRRENQHPQEEPAAARERESVVDPTDYLKMARRTTEATRGLSVREGPHEPADYQGESDADLGIERERGRLVKIARSIARRVLSRSDEALVESGAMLEAVQAESEVDPEETVQAQQLEEARGDLGKEATQLEEELAALEREVPGLAMSRDQLSEQPRAPEPTVVVESNQLPSSGVPLEREVPSWRQDTYREAYAHTTPVQRQEVKDLQDDIEHAHDKADTALRVAAVGSILNAAYTHHERVVARRNEAKLGNADEQLTERIKRQEVRLEQQRQNLDRLEQRPAEQTKAPVSVERLAAERSYIGEVARLASEQRSITQETRQIVKEQAPLPEQRTLSTEELTGAAAARYERPPQPEETSSQPLWSERRFAEHIEKGPGMMAVEDQPKGALTPVGGQTSDNVPASVASPSPVVDTPDQPEPKPNMHPSVKVPTGPPSHLLAYVIILAVIVLGLIMLLARLAH